MGFKRKPIYEFENENSIGLDKIPDGSRVIVKNYKGQNIEFIKNDPDGVIKNDQTIESVLNSNNIPTDIQQLRIIKQITKINQDVTIENGHILVAENGIDLNGNNIKLQGNVKIKFEGDING